MALPISYNFRNLVVRKTTTIMTALGIALTVAVLGCGIDICYPAEHEQLRAEIVESGCVISEEPRAMEPFKHNFPKRNRLIAALASAVVVVEGTARSGALSTARWAADMGREILAVPGSIRARQSEGTNLLILVSSSLKLLTK